MEIIMGIGAIIAAVIGVLVLIGSVLWSVFYGAATVVGFFQAIHDRFTNEEDKHYRDNVDQ